MPGDERFPKHRRLRVSREFQAVFDLRCSASDGIVVIYGRNNGTDNTRLGLVVSRKVGNAVARNRWKRLLREAFRQTRERMPKGVDLILIPKAPQVPTLATLLRSLPKLVTRVAKRLPPATEKPVDL